LVKRTVILQKVGGAGTVTFKRVTGFCIRTREKREDPCQERASVGRFIKVFVQHLARKKSKDSQFAKSRVLG